jgi:hypothetical protein
VYWNIPTDCMCLLKYPHWLNSSYFSNIPTGCIFCVLTEYFVLKYPYWLYILYWNIPTGCICCTEISLLAAYVVLKYPYWLHMLYWNIPTEWIFFTEISLLTVYVVLKTTGSSYLFNGHQGFGLHLPEGRKGREERRKEGRA